MNNKIDSDFNILQERLEQRFYKFYSNLEEFIFVDFSEFYIKKIYDDYILVHHVQFEGENFDCSLYRIPIEILYCDDEEFNQLNERLNYEYNNNNT